MKSCFELYIKVCRVHVTTTPYHSINNVTHTQRRFQESSIKHEGVYSSRTVPKCIVLQCDTVCVYVCVRRQDGQTNRVCLQDVAAACLTRELQLLISSLAGIKYRLRRCLQEVALCNKTSKVFVNIVYYVTMI